MKKYIIGLVAVSAAVSVFAQGTVNFINLSPANGVNTKVYGPEVGDASLSKTGNTTAGLPAGTQVYTGPMLAGGSFMAQLYGATGAGALESALTAATPTSTFRTGSAAGGFVLQTATLTGVAKDAAAATVQVRAWDNSSGQYATWAAAEVAWNAGTIAAGKSPLLTVNAIGGDLNTSPYMAGLQGFNIYMKVIPEPSTFALLGLGALGMMIFRRK